MPVIARAMPLPNLQNLATRLLAIGAPGGVAVMLAGQLALATPVTDRAEIVAARQILPPLASSPRSTPTAPSERFSLTLEPRDSDALLASLRDAGVAEESLSEIRALAPSWTGGDGSYARVGLDLTSGGAAKIVALRLVDGDGVKEWSRASSRWVETFLAPAAIARVELRAGEDSYWVLRREGVADADAARVAAMVRERLSAGNAAQIYIANRPARFDSGQDRAMAMVALGKGVDRHRFLPLAGGRWIDVDRAAEGAFARPVAGRISSAFGTRVHPILHFARLHAGIDFAATWGTPVYAAADGRVDRAGWRGGYGRQVELIHPGDMTSSYSHLSRIVAAEDASVTKGDLIGFVGASGLATGPHLHFEVRRAGVPIDPMRAGAVFDEGIVASLAALRRRAERIETAG